jgi:molybdopterin-guanine dinucleotide biosynthesis protein B
MTEKALGKIVGEAQARWELQDVVVIHRVGELRPGDQIVLVATASGHRRAALAACEFIIDYLKTQAPFWKQERSGATVRWVEARRSDDEAAARWQDEGESALQTSRALSKARKPVVGLAAWSGAGKTTLLKAVLPLLRHRGIRLGMVKHAHHAFDIDKPGKDSYELRKAGATQILVASSRREALVVEKETEAEPVLDRLLARLDQDALDMVLVEGFKHERFPKIELYRAELGKPPLYPDDDDIIAVVTDSALPIATDLPLLDINDPGAVVEFLCARFCGN